MMKLNNFYASMKVFVQNFREKLIKIRNGRTGRKIQKAFLFMIFIFELFKQLFLT